jgi:(4-alkanoyl-5-oxo-2,5-dihydrofuran-3-yl)methyl phosphate reductase
LAARAARASGVRHIVKLSSLDVEQSLAIGAWHQEGEAAIRASRIGFTFVRPAGFMSNLLAWADSIKAEGVVRTSTGDGRRAFIHSADIAAVVVEALVSPKYLGKELAITGPEAVTFAEAAEKIGAAIGRRVRFEAISDQEAGRRFAASGEPVEVVKAHVALWRAIREGRLGMVTGEVERVLGRPPISLDTWVSKNVEAFG